MQNERAQGDGDTINFIISILEIMASTKHCVAVYP